MYFYTQVFSLQQCLCGGGCTVCVSILQVQYQRNGGKCGVCGDPWDGPWENEPGGKYALGIIVRKYGVGDVITVKVQLTASHKGYMEFRLCANDIPLKKVRGHSHHCSTALAKKNNDDDDNYSDGSNGLRSGGKRGGGGGGGGEITITVNVHETMQIKTTLGMYNVYPIDECFVIRWKRTLDTCRFQSIPSFSRLHICF